MVRFEQNDAVRLATRYSLLTTRYLLHVLWPLQELIGIRIHFSIRNESPEPAKWRLAQLALDWFSRRSHWRHKWTYFEPVRLFYCVALAVAVTDADADAEADAVGIAARTESRTQCLLCLAIPIGDYQQPLKLA